MINVKTIMISDETYRKLAAIKDKKSFTILLSEMVDKLKQNNKDKILKLQVLSTLRMLKNCRTLL